MKATLLPDGPSTESFGRFVADFGEVVDNAASFPALLGGPYTGIRLERDDGVLTEQSFGGPCHGTGMDVGIDISELV